MANISHARPADHQRPAWLNIIIVVVSTLCLAVFAIGVGWLLGQQIAHDKWSLLITITGMATYMVIAYIDMRVGFLTWIVTAPFSRFVYLDLDLGRGIPNITLSRVMTGVLLVLLLAQLATHRRKVMRLCWADGLALAFLGALALSVPDSLSGIERAAQTFFDYILTPVAVYFIARNLITNERELKMVMAALIIVGCYMGIMATREQLTGKVWFYVEDRSVYYTASLRRVVGLLGNPAFIAVCCAMGVPWAWYLILYSKRSRLLVLAAMVVMVSGVFFCMNRSAWVGLGLSLVTMALFVRRFRGVFLLILAVGAILAGVYWALIIASPVIRERLQAQGPIDYRVEAWRIAVEMIRDYPVFGVGYENYRFYYPRYGTWDIYLRNLPSPHNTYLWVWVTAGIVAFVPFMLLLLALALMALGAIVRSRDEPDSANAALAGTFLACMTAVLAPAFVMDVLAGNYNSLLLFLVMGSYVGYVTGQRAVKRRRTGGLRALLLEAAE
jgi:O-antigen ligase